MPSFGGFFTITPGQDTTVEVGQGGLDGVLIGNESGYTLVIKMGGNYSRSLYPGWVDYFPVPQTQFSGTITLQNYTKLNNVATWPASYAQVDVIGAGETVHGTYPAPLVRSSNIGNSVNTLGGTSTAIQNDNNAAGTSIVEATVSGDGSSAVSWTNDAIFKNGDAAHPGTVSLDNGLITTNGNGILTISNGKSIHGKDTGGASQIMIGPGGDNSVIIRSVGTGQPVILADQDGTAIIQASKASIQILRGINYQQTGTQINGGTSGAATLWQDFVGLTKRVILILNNFKTGASTQTLVLPTAFTTMARIDAGEIGRSADPGGFQLLLGGVVQNIRVVTAYAATGSTFGTQTTIYQGTSGDCKTGFDTISFPANSGGGFNGVAVITGQ